MTGIVEAAAIGAMTCTATSSLSIAGYGHAVEHPCLAGMFGKKAAVQKKHHLEPPSHPTLHNKPLDKTGVTVKLNNGKSQGAKKVRFDGEILSISNDKGEYVRTLALGACDIKVDGSRILATPTPVPTIELRMGSPEEAKVWADEFKEASLVGGSQERIHELILHCLVVEKHLKDLRTRCEKGAEQEKQVAKLKKQMSMSKLGFAKPDEPARPSALAAWFLPTASSAPSPAADAKLRKELELEHDKLEQANKLAAVLSKRMQEDPDEDECHIRLLNHVFQAWSLEVHRSRKVQMQLCYDESRKAQAQVAELQSRLDKLASQPPANQAQKGYAPSPATPQAAAQNTAAEQENRAKNSSANLMRGARQAGAFPAKETSDSQLDKSLAVVPVFDDQVYASKSARLGCMEQQMRQQLDLRKTAAPTVFSSLEEKIRSRQTQVNQDFDFLQQMFQVHLDDQKSIPMTV